MWILRILTGPLAGHKFELQDGSSTVGRGAECEIAIPYLAISKEHAMLKVSGDTLEVADNNSSNGVYVNGVRVRNRRLQNGDRVGFSDIMADIHEIKGVKRNPNLQIVSNAARLQNSSPSFAAGTPNLGGAAESFSVNSNGIGNQAPADLGPKQWWSPAVDYVENVVLPGIYRFGFKSEFKWVLITFILLFAFLVTLLSTIPLVQITQSSIEQESQLRALGLAEHLADRFSQALQSGSVANVNLDSILRQKGVRAAYVVASNDGHIIAPGSKSGTFATDSFANQARVKDERFVDNISSSLIGASVPISQYNAERGRFEPQYDAIILYDMVGMSLDDGRILSLFVKVLTIAVILGGALFFFLYRFVLYPVTYLSDEINRVMIQKSGDVKSVYKFPEMDKLTELVNSLLAHATYEEGSSGTQFSIDRVSEVTNLVHFMNAACMGVGGDGRIIAVNAGFGDVTGVREDYYREKPLSSMTDQSLTLNMEELMERAKASPSVIADTAISISERDFKMSCQVFMKAEGADFFLFFVQPVEG